MNKHFNDNIHKLVILDYETMTIHLYDNEFLKKNYYDIGWKDEFYSEVEGIESFITTVLNFDLDSIHWMEYENIIENKEKVSNKATV